MNTFRAPTGELLPEASTPAEICRFVVEAAVHAPSVHNTQPWWFSTGDNELAVHADIERRLRIADPDGREMLISCGAAVFNARVGLRYLGFVPTVHVLPDPDLPSLVARISWLDQTPPAEYERALFAEIPRRRTHRGGFDAQRLPEGLLTALANEAHRENAVLRILTGDGQRACLAAVVEAADCALRQDGARAREEARWTPPLGSSRRDGVPPTAYPASPERTEPNFPARDFGHGHGWGLPPSGQGLVPRPAGTVAVLTTKTDQPADWIGAGQALQRVLLCASSCAITAAMHSQPLEIPQLRDFIRMQLSSSAHPQMVLRFGTTSQTAISVRRRIEDVLL